MEPGPPATASRRRGWLLGARAGLLVLAVAAAAMWRRPWEKPPEPIRVAVAVPLSGSQAAQGHNVLKAVELCFQTINNTGGVNGQKLQAVPFDDSGLPALAHEQAELVVASPTVAVLGHLVSATCEAAGPVYKQAHLPAVAGTANADQLTRDNPYFFHVIFNTSAEGRNLAIYTRRVLEQKNASIISTDETFGKAVAEAFAASFQELGGTIRNHWVYNRRINRREASIDTIASALRADGEAGIVLLAVSPSTLARDMVVQLRTRGVQPRFLGGTNLGSGAFNDLFKDFDAERESPGYYTDGIDAVAPLLYDSAGARAQEFIEVYRKAYGVTPDSRAAKYYEAASVVAAAIQMAEVENTPESLDRDRQKVRDCLAAIDRPERAVHSVSGLVYFDEQHALPQPVRIGRFLRGQLISAPQQFVRVNSPAAIDVERETAAGKVFHFGKQLVWNQRVVYTGIDVNKISRIDQGRGVFAADFFLWFRYLGDDDVLDVEFTSAVDKGFDSKSPVAARTVGGMKYRLYRVRGEFKSVFNFRDYPFDSQELVLRLQNARLTRDQVVYAVDTFGLRLPREPSSNVKAYSSLAQWRFQGLRYFQDTLTSNSTRGDPDAFTDNSETEFSGFNAVALLQRRTAIFLIKVMVPLGLLVLVLFVTLFFPVSLTKERLTVAISGLLASAVLLTGINAQMPEASYTTAMEYGFYVFFGLCLFCITVGLLLERLRGHKWNLMADRLEMVSKVVYTLVVVGTVGTYIVVYGFSSV
jgi:branched-chain amino acid transport system substrate-binding protein